MPKFHSSLIFSLVLFLFVTTVGPASAASDVEAKLTTNDGTSTFDIIDSDSVNLFSIDSDGNVSTAGTLEGSNYAGVAMTVSGNDLNISMNGSNNPVTKATLAGTVLSTVTPDYYVSGEENAVLNSATGGGFVFAMGNGSEAHYVNHVAVADIKVITLAVSCETSTSAGNTIVVTDNGNETACSITTPASDQLLGTTNGHKWTTCDVDLDTGDGLGFKLTVSNGTANDCRVEAGIKYR
jgi:hypothetical protein